MSLATRPHLLVFVVLPGLPLGPQLAMHPVTVPWMRALRASLGERGLGTIDQPRALAPGVETRCASLGPQGAVSTPGILERSSSAGPNRRRGLRRLPTIRPPDRVRPGPGRRSSMAPPRSAGIPSRLFGGAVPHNGLRTGSGSQAWTLPGPVAADLASTLHAGPFAREELQP